MKYVGVKSFVGGVLVGALGLSTVFAASGIKTVRFNDIKVFCNGQPIYITQQLISVVKEGETDAVTYMSVRDILTQLGCEVAWNAANQSIDIHNKQAAPSTTNATGTTNTATIVPAKVTVDNATLVANMVAEVNRERAAVGAAALTLDPAVSAVCATKARDLIAGGYFEHQSPTLGSPFDMLNQANVPYNVAGENLAFGHATAAAVVAAWLESPGHKDNMLDKEFTKTGVACIARDDGALFWVQMYTG